LDFRDISGTSSKFWTSWRITNICPIHTQLIQNYINIFRVSILILTFYIHSLSHCKNFSIAQTSMISQHTGFSQNVGQHFPEMSADISDFPQNVGRHFLKRHFKCGWGCRGGEGLKMKCRPTFQKCRPTFKTLLKSFMLNSLFSWALSFGICFYFMQQSTYHSHTTKICRIIILFEIGNCHTHIECIWPWSWKNQIICITAWEAA